VAFIASAGTAELERKVTNVIQAKTAFDRFDKKRKEYLIMTPPMGCKLIPMESASIMPIKQRQKMTLLLPELRNVDNENG
jgi:hypothetical protein